MKILRDAFLSPKKHGKKDESELMVASETSTAISWSKDT